MKLYLSSYRMPSPKQLGQLIGKEHVSVAYIPNAKDYYAERARSFKLNESMTYMQDLGFAPQVVDLRNYNDPAALAAALSAYDMIWVGGGNTFCLRYEMQRSGFDQVIRGLLDNGLVYGGESAGACVAGTTLHGLEGADEPAFTEKTIWEGLNLLPNFILPHTDNIAFAEDIDQIRTLYKDDLSLIELTDSQALIIDGNDQKIVEKEIA